jgi:hypothetical protein
VVAAAESFSIMAAMMMVLATNELLDMMLERRMECFGGRDQELWSIQQQRRRCRHRNGEKMGLKFL